MVTEWVGRHTSPQVGGWVNRWKGGCITNRWMIGEWVDRWKERQMGDKVMVNILNGQLGDSMDACTHGWMHWLTGEWIGGDGWTKEWIGKQVRALGE